MLKRGLKWSDWIAYGATLALFVAFLAYCKDQGGKKSSLKESAEDHLRHADTYYYFGMMGRGSMAALSGGEKQIKYAVEALAKERAVVEAEMREAEASSRSEALLEQLRKDEQDLDRLERRIEGAAQDLKYQRELHHDTFHGVFPWSHFMAKASLFQNPRSTGSFELNDQPEVIAARSAVKDLVEKVLAAQTITAQHDVVFVTDPSDFPDENPEDRDEDKLSAQLENEALYLFNRDPRFFVHNKREVEEALDDNEQLLLRAMEPTAEMLRKMRDLWGHRDLLVVRVKKMDEVNRHHFYAAQARLFKGEVPVPAAVYNNYGFCRDRTFVLGAVLIFNALMLLGAIMLFRFLAGLTAHDGLPPSWRTSVGVGTIGFVWGRVAVWGLVEIVEKFVPADETLAILSFWWPVLAGFIMLLGPAFILRFAEERFRWLDRAFGLYNRRGALFATVTMGSAAYVAGAALWVRYWGSWPLMPPLLLASVGGAWIIGRALEDTDPITGRWGAIVAILALGIGPAFSSAFPSGVHHLKLWAVALPVLSVGGVAVWRRGSLFDSPSAAVEASPRATSAETLQDLIKLAHDPPFRSTRSFLESRERLDDWLDGKTTRLHLTGPAGVGKTALLGELRRWAFIERNVSAMEASCPESQEGATPDPYRVFADAIAGHFSVNLLMPPHGQLAGIDKAIDGIFEEVVPFSDLLFPPCKGEGVSGSKKEIFHSVTAALRCLASKKPVMLLVDDAHWIDAGSRDLLEHILTEFPAGAPTPLAIVVSNRSADSLFSSEETIALEALDEAEIQGLLTEDMNFSPQAASELAEAVGNEEGNLHWLFQMITCLADKKLLERTDKGWNWEDGTKLSDHLPDDLRQSVLAVVETHPQFRPLLECAACIGPKFTVEVLAEAVGMKRFECIRLLDQIEAESGFVLDLPDEDDTFAFRSSFLLEVIRKVLGVRAVGPNDPSPQRIREYHAELAKAWHTAVQSSNSAIYRLATHRYAAGTRYSADAMRELLIAAGAASSQFQHDQARQYLEMALECAVAAGRDGDELAGELLLLECHEAHVEGRGRVEAAERALEMIRSRPQSDYPLHVATARACYDAGIDTHEQKYFADAVSVGKEIIERFEQPHEQAEGHHFIGIGLPVSETKERRRHLDLAMELCEKAGDGDEVLRLRARIANSLAEQLSYGSDEDRQAARALFNLSIEIKGRPSTRDVEGLALAHGGLGRLSFFASEPDYEEARGHFEKDLSYSEKIGSLTGQCKMHSLLGACDLKESLRDGTARFEQALGHYESAMRLAEEDVDKIFAMAGLMETQELLGNHEEAGRCAQRLIALIQSRSSKLREAQPDSDPVAAIPPPCLDSIRSALSHCEACRTSDWHKELSELIR